MEWNSAGLPRSGPGSPVPTWLRHSRINTNASSSKKRTVTRGRYGLHKIYSMLSARAISAIGGDKRGGVISQQTARVSSLAGAPWSFSLGALPILPLAECVVHRAEKPEFV